MHPSQNLMLFVHYRPKITEGLLGINEVHVGKKVSKNLRELPERFFISVWLPRHGCSLALFQLRVAKLVI